MNRQRPFEPPFYPPPQNNEFNSSPLDAEIASVLYEIREEIEGLDASPEFGNHYRNAKRLLTQEAAKLENNVDPEWLELDIEKQIKLVKKVLIPQFRYPRFNFVGKIIGPKGVTLQNIAKTFKCHVYVLGRGSTRDRVKEQELLATGDPTYAHYSGPLHVKIETTAAPALAYKRVSGVMEVLAQLLQPVKETFIEGITPPIDPAKKESGENGDDRDEPPQEKSVDSNEYQKDSDNAMPPSNQGDGGNGFNPSGPGMGGGPRGRGGPGRGRGAGGRGGRGGGGGGPISSDPYRGPPSQNLARGGGPMRRGGSGPPPPFTPGMSIPGPSAHGGMGGMGGPPVGMSPHGGMGMSHGGMGGPPGPHGGMGGRGGGGGGGGGRGNRGFRGGGDRGRMRFNPY